MSVHVDPRTLGVLEDFGEDHEEALSARIRELLGQSFGPPPKFTVSEWADDRRELSSEASSEPGKWSTSRVEPSRGVMDACSDPEIEQVSVMIAAQSFKSEVILNLSGFHVDLDPCPMLILQPTLQMAEAFSKDRLSTMIRDTPVIAAKIGHNSRDSEDTILHKKYVGGHITLAGANSPASLASRPIRILLCDEVDRYEASAGKEGDPVSLAIERTTTFWNRKIVLVSTPTIKGVSRIEASYLESDQRRYFVPCPKCAHRQHLEWKQVRWPEGKPELARYHCNAVDAETGEVCDYGWSEAERLKAIARGQWVATRPEVKGHAGFHLNRIASPWQALGVMARDFVLAKPHPQRLKTWVNTRLAETWEEKGDRADGASLIDRREEYTADPVPMMVGLVAAGVDIQDDRFEIEWTGWGSDDESWALDYQVRYGDPSTPAFWEALDHALLRVFRHPSGIDLRVEASCIDSGGHFTQQVYAFARMRASRNVFAIKGAPGAGRPIWPPKGTKNAAKKVTVFVLGVDQAKDLHYRRLAINEPGPGYCHFPRTEAFEKAYFDGLTAEKAMKTVDRRGFPVVTWVKDRVRNEPLDCRVYSMAARLSLGIDMARRLAALRQVYEANQMHSPTPAPNYAASPPVMRPMEPGTVAETANATRRRRTRSKGVQL